MLLVLDNCEHVIDAAAAFGGCGSQRRPQVQILATSREPLRIEGERVHRLSPLASPPASTSLTAAEALGFPAVQLFVERAAASLDEFELSDADAPIVADICRKLDGIRAGDRVGGRPRRRLRSARGGGAPGRSVSAADKGPAHGAAPASDIESDTRLELSRLLPEPERAVLRRLAVFAGGFTHEAARQSSRTARRRGRRSSRSSPIWSTKSLVMADIGGRDRAVIGCPKRFAPTLSKNSAKAASASR